MEKQVKILAIIDDRAGNNTQVLGIANRLAEALQAEIIAKIADYNVFARLPFIKFINKLYHITNPEDFNVKADIVISAGRRAAFIGYMHQKHHGSKWIHNMWPGYIGKHADILILPFHDKPRKLPNVIKFLGAPNNLDVASLEKEAKNFMEFSDIDKPKVVCLIGGSHKSGVFNNEMALRLSKKINKVVSHLNAYPMVTISRRTGRSEANILKANISDPKYFYEFHGPNPYKAMLYYADYIIVTSDSISMISEAVATQKPVMIFDDPRLSGRKHREFIKELRKRNCVTYLGNSYTNLQKIDLMNDLIEEIIRKLHLSK